RRAEHPATPGRGHHAMLTRTMESPLGGTVEFKRLPLAAVGVEGAVEAAWPTIGHQHDRTRPLIVDGTAVAGDMDFVLSLFVDEAGVLPDMAVRCQPVDGTRIVLRHPRTFRGVDDPRLQLRDVGVGGHPVALTLPDEQ